jgi:Protein of unknown function (DUF1036)
VSHGRDEVYFKNDYGHTMYVAYMRRDYGCLPEGQEPWRVLGWIKLDPGATEYRDNETENQWFYYYAEAVDGAMWIGPWIAEVRDAKFSTCSGTGHTSLGGSGQQVWYDVGMRELDTVKYPGVRFIP